MQQMKILIDKPVELREYKIYSGDKQFNLGPTNCFISAKTMKLFNIETGNDLMGKKVLGLGDESYISIAMVV